MGKSRRHVLAAGLLAFASHAAAQVASVCPKTEVCFKLNIPQNTASSGNGDIFFQISAPSTYNYVALGQGNRMAGANIFVVYTAGNGNVTVSPRLATGHNMPQFNSDAQVTLLEGSGVSDGKMVANVRCSSCNTWSGGSASFSGDKGNWIYAIKNKGGAQDSTSQSANIDEHDEKATFQWPYANAKGGDSVNPLVNAGNSGSGSANGGNGGSSNEDDSSDSGVTPVSSDDGDQSKKMLIAHGTLAALAFVIFFPFGAITIRLASFTGVVWVHAAFQAFAYIIYIAAFGLGVYIANQTQNLSQAHPIIGIVLFAVLFFEPILGLLHHSSYKKHQARTWSSHVHLWLGRAAITLGMINGGLGLQLAGDAPKGGYIAYGVVAGVVWLAWVAAMIIGERKRARAAKGGHPSNMLPHSNGTNPAGGHYEAKDRA